MRQLTYHLLDVFADRLFGGNQLAVFTDADGLDASMMQQIARELNLSESVFILPPSSDEYDYRLRIFTPSIELPMAGHPTVGTGYLMAHLGMIEDGSNVRLEEGVGLIEIQLIGEGDSRQVVMTQPLPEFGDIWQDHSQMADLLNIDISDLLTEYPIQTVSCGVPFWYVPVASREALDRISVNLTLWQELLEDSPTPHLFTFTPNPMDKSHTVYSRMFAPAMGIPEDPATGGASGPLGAYLVKYGLASGNMVSEQGFAMGRPSLITLIAEYEADIFTKIQIAGQSVYVGQGILNLPDTL